MKSSLLLTLLFVALTLVMALPFSLHPGSRLLVDAPDSHLFLWTLAWEAHALVTRPWAIFDSNFYYPYANTLAWSENLLGSGLLAAPIIWLTGNVVLALNLVSLLSHVLCGLGAWLLARKAGVGPYGATVSGIIFAFSPARFFRMSQLHLTTVHWVPFSLAFVYAYRRARPAPRPAPGHPVLHAAGADQRPWHGVPDRGHPRAADLSRRAGRTAGPAAADPRHGSDRARCCSHLSAGCCGTTAGRRPRQA